MMIITPASINTNDVDDIYAKIMNKENPNSEFWLWNAWTDLVRW